MNLVELRNLVIGTALTVIFLVGLNIVLDSIEVSATGSKWFIFDFYADHFCCRTLFENEKNGTRMTQMKRINTDFLINLF